ncbi:MAG: V-type ATP synthase subunit F [Defluviitaleaceae bacterium]|nr:V-type ATP synthase subunit F [Defluviitaleaceae bacterium]
MKIYVVSDNPNFHIGLGLAGVSGRYAYTPEEMGQVLDEISAGAGLIIVTSSLAAKCGDVLHEFRAKNPLPLVTIVPDI